MIINILREHTYVLMNRTRNGYAYDNDSSSDNDNNKYNDNDNMI